MRTSFPASPLFGASSEAGVNSCTASVKVRWSPGFSWQLLLHAHHRERHEVVFKRLYVRRRQEPVFEGGAPFALRTDMALLPLLHHVLEPHPLLIEVEIYVSRPAVPILQQMQLRGAFDSSRRLIHLLAK